MIEKETKIIIKEQTQIYGVLSITFGFIGIFIFSFIFMTVLLLTLCFAIVFRSVFNHLIYLGIDGDYLVKVRRRLQSLW